MRVDNYIQSSSLEVQNLEQAFYFSEEKVSAGAYLFGFNGQEKEDEVYGESNAYDFGARLYDTRIGRFMSIDPDFYKYPWNSTYAYAINSPIKFVDKNGEGPDVVRNNSSSQIKITGSADVRIATVKDGKYSVTSHDKLVGSIVLNPGDVYYEVDECVTISQDGTTQVFQGGIGKVVRADGAVEYVMINDVDFIDVEEGQTFVVDGKDVVNNSDKEYNRKNPDGSNMSDPVEKVVSTEDIDGDNPSATTNYAEDGTGWNATPNKGEIKTDNFVSTVTLSDDTDSSGKATGKVKVETTGALGSTTTQ